LLERVDARQVQENQPWAPAPSFNSAHTAISGKGAPQFGQLTRGSFNAARLTAILSGTPKYKLGSEGFAIVGLRPHWPHVTYSIWTRCRRSPMSSNGNTVHDLSPFERVIPRRNVSGCFVTKVSRPVTSLRVPSRYTGASRKSGWRLISCNDGADGIVTTCPSINLSSNRASESFMQVLTFGRSGKCLRDQERFRNVAAVYRAAVGELVVSARLASITDKPLVCVDRPVGRQTTVVKFGSGCFRATLIAPCDAERVPTSSGTGSSGPSCRGAIRRCSRCGRKRAAGAYIRNIVPFAVGVSAAGKPQLPPGFVHDQGHAVGQIDAAVARPHRNVQVPLDRYPVHDPGGQSPGFGTE
jgi:hypothetical protein